MYYLPAAGWAAILLGIGSLHRLPQPPSGLGLDKVGHFGMYGVLGALAAWGWIRAGRAPVLYIPLVVAMLVGAADEIHQSTNPDRSAEVADLVADIAGVAVGFTLIVRRNTAPITGSE